MNQVIKLEQVKNQVNNRRVVMSQDEHQVSVRASLICSAGLPEVCRGGALLPLAADTGGLMGGWRRQGERSPPRPGAWTSHRIVSRNRSQELLRNSSEKCLRPARSAARYDADTRRLFADSRWSRQCSFSDSGPHTARGHGSVHRHTRRQTPCLKPDALLVRAFFHR